MNLRRKILIMDYLGLTPLWIQKELLTSQSQESSLPLQIKADITTTPPRSDYYRSITDQACSKCGYSISINRQGKNDDNKNKYDWFVIEGKHVKYATKSIDESLKEGTRQLLQAIVSTIDVSNHGKVANAEIIGTRNSPSDEGCYSMCESCERYLGQTLKVFAPRMILFFGEGVQSLLGNLEKAKFNIKGQIPLIDGVPVVSAGHLSEIGKSVSGKKELWTKLLQARSMIYGSIKLNNF